MLGTWNRGILVASWVGISVVCPIEGVAQAGRVQARPQIQIPFGGPAVIDGIPSAGEWESAAEVHIEVEPGWVVPVRIKHDGGSLYVLFVGLKQDMAERYPEVLLDVDGGRGNGWAADDWWLHASYRDCDGHGSYNRYDTCAAERSGWEANNFPLGDPGAVEIRVSLDHVGLDTHAPGPFGIALNVTDTRTSWSHWPRTASLQSPAGWAEATLGSHVATEFTTPGQDTAEVFVAGGDLERNGVFRATGVPRFGGLRWTFATAEKVWGPVTIAEGTAYVGSQDSVIYALDLATGQPKWHLRTRGGNSSGPAVAGGVVYAGSGDGHLYAIEAETGRERWRFPAGGRVVSSPAVADELVLFGGDDGHFYAVSAVTGTEAWRFRTGGRVTALPSVVDGTVYVTSHDRHLYALEARSGRELWKFEAAAALVFNPAVSDSLVYAGSLDGTVYALDRRSGRERWRFRADGWVLGVAAADGFVYFGSGTGAIHAVDAATGEERWRFPTGAGVNAIPAVAGDLLYVGSHDGHLYALDRSTGAELWKLRTEDEVHSSAAVSDGLVVVGSADGHVYAIHGGSDP